MTMACGASRRGMPCSAELRGERRREANEDGQLQPSRNSRKKAPSLGRTALLRYWRIAASCGYILRLEPWTGCVPCVCVGVWLCAAPSSSVPHVHDRCGAKLYENGRDRTCSLCSRSVRCSRGSLRLFCFLVHAHLALEIAPSTNACMCCGGEGANKYDTPTGRWPRRRRHIVDGHAARRQQQQRPAH